MNFEVALLNPGTKGFSPICVRPLGPLQTILGADFGLTLRWYQPSLDINERPIEPSIRFCNRRDDLTQSSWSRLLRRTHHVRTGSVTSFRARASDFRSVPNYGPIAAPQRTTLKANCVACTRHVFIFAYRDRRNCRRRHLGNS